MTVKRDALADARELIGVVHTSDRHALPTTVQAVSSWLAEHDKQRRLEDADALFAGNYFKASAFLRVRAVQGGEPQADQGIHIRDDAAEATSEGTTMTTVCIHGNSPATCNDFRVVPDVGRGGVGG